MGFPAWAVGRVTVAGSDFEPDEIGPVRPVGRDDVEIAISIDIDKHAIRRELHAGGCDSGEKQVGPTPPRQRGLWQPAEDQIQPTIAVDVADELHIPGMLGDLAAIKCKTRPENFFLSTRQQNHNLRLRLRRQAWRRDGNTRRLLTS